MSEELISKLRQSAVVMECLPEYPGYNGSAFVIDDVEAARVASALNAAVEALSRPAPVAAVQGEAVAITKCPPFCQCGAHPAPTAAAPVAVLVREIGESTWFDHRPVKPGSPEHHAIAASAEMDYCIVYTAPAVAGVPEGMVLVRLQPTQEMMAAGFAEEDEGMDCVAIYRAMLAAAPAAPSAQEGKVPEGILEIGRRMVADAKDNDHCTAHPLFCVEKRRLVTGIDTDYTDNIAWIDEDGYILPADEAAALEAAYDETGEVPNGYTRTGFVEEWEHVDTYLTPQAAEARINGGKDGRVNVNSAYRNSEMRAVRDFLMSLAAPAPVATEAVAQGGGVDGAVELLRTWQTWLGPTRNRCDDSGKKLWDRIDATCALLTAPPAKESQTEKGHE